MANDYFYQQPNTGSFVSLTSALDVTRLNDVDIKSPEFKELLVRLYQDINNIAQVLNTKTTGYNLLEEFVDSSNFFNPVPNSTGVNNELDLRPEYRKVINFGPIGPGVNTPIPHNLPITSTWTFTGITGTGSDTVGFNYFPLPWASPSGTNNISLQVNQTSIVITNNSGVTFTNCYVILEYLKN